MFASSEGLHQRHAKTLVLSPTGACRARLFTAMCALPRLLARLALQLHWWLHRGSRAAARRPRHRRLLVRLADLTQLPRLRLDRLF